MTARTRIKICGLQHRDDLIAAISAGADAVGFVLSEGSPRTITIDTLAALLPLVPAWVTPVAVVRNPEPQLVDAITALPDPRVMVQFHGQEDRAMTDRPGRPFIRALPFDDPDIRTWDAHRLVRLLLIDSPQPGSGRSFDWTRVAAMVPGLRSPVALAGGLTPETVGKAIAAIHPYAVDVSSGVEARPGLKDPQRIEAFCRAVRAADGVGSRE